MVRAQKPDAQFIGVREYARRLGQSYTKVYELARQDRLLVPVYRDNGRWVVSAVALDELIHRQHDSTRQEVAA